MEETDLIGLFSSEQGEKLFDSYKLRLSELQEKKLGYLGIHAQLLDLKARVGELFLKSAESREWLYASTSHNFFLGILAYMA